MPASIPPTKADRVASIINDYFDIRPDSAIPGQRVSFGTSGHRGKASQGKFNEAHIVAITQAVCEFRKHKGITGPLYIGKDTHALSGPALDTALEVLAANEVYTKIHANNHPTPTPVISHAILTHNRSSQTLADGIVVTPSHNPPEDGGFKYNETTGGPAGTETTGWIEKRANALLAENNRSARRIPLKQALASGYVTAIDLIQPYVDDLAKILRMDAISASGIRLGADPLGGSSLPYWEPIATKYNLNIHVVNTTIDPTFAFMPPDHDGVIRMDCSSAYAMRGLISHASNFDLAFGNDPDADRHGIVTPDGLMSPNHYLSVAIWYLLTHRKEWITQTAVGKTIVTTHLINRICASLGRSVYETPVGFKWFVDGLFSKQIMFGGEESAGASFLCFDESPWSTDKDGLLLNLLAAEITAVTGKNPAQLYAELTDKYGTPYYTRIDAPATSEQKNTLKNLTQADISQNTLAGEPIEQVLAKAPGNNEAIGGLKVVTANGWFAARPSGTEDLYKIYAESLSGEQHLTQLVAEAKDLISTAFAAIR